MRDSKIRKKGIAAAVLLAGAILATAFTAYAKESIVVENITVSAKEEYGEDEVLEPEITVTAAGCELDSMEWDKELADWKPGKRVRLTLTITSEDKVFKNSYNRADVKLTKLQYVSAKAKDNNTLIVKLDYIPVMTLGFTQRAGWSDLTMTKATWKKVPFATGYQVDLYADDKKVKSVKTKTNSVDLAEYMKKEAAYYYDVKAIPDTPESKKYLKAGAAITSENTVLEGLGDVSGQWSGEAYEQEAGGYATNSWKLIMGKWYYFDGNGIRATGWLNMGGRWYYMNAAGEMQTGWVNVDGKWYYLNPNGGEMLTGWVETSPAKWYYMYQDGSMASNTYIGTYRVDESGLWIP